MTRPAKSISGKIAIYPAQARLKALIALDADAATRLLVHTISIRQSRDGWCHETVAQLAYWSGLSKRTITDRLCWLKDHGIVQAVHYRTEGGPQGQAWEWKRRLYLVAEWLPATPEEHAPDVGKSTQIHEASLSQEREREKHTQDGSRALAGALAFVEVRPEPKVDQGSKPVDNNSSAVIEDSDSLPNLIQLFSPMPSRASKADRELVRACQLLLAASGGDYADILCQEGIDSFESASLEALQRLHGALAYEVLRA